jgi:hypothetical protein
LSDERRQVVQSAPGHLRPAWHADAADLAAAFGQRAEDLELALAPDVKLSLLDWDQCCDTFIDGDLTAFAGAIAS